MTDNMRKWQMVPISRVILLFAFLLLCDRVDGVPIEITPEAK